MTDCPICGALLGPAAITAPDRGQATPGEFGVAICPGCGAGVTLPRVGAGELAAFYPAGYGPHEGVERGLLSLVSRAIRWMQGRLAWRRPPIAALADRQP